MNKILVSITIGATLLAAGLPAMASEALAKSNGCLMCHDMAKKKMGPAFKTSAAELKKAGADADKVLAAIKAKHKDLKANDADLKALASWILTL